MHHTVPARPLLAVACSLLLLTAACGSDDALTEAPSGSSAATSPSKPTATPDVSPTMSPAPTIAPSGAADPAGTAASPAGTVITIVYADGKASGDTGRIKVKVGELVTLKLTSDVQTQAHIHGADIEVVAAPGVEVVQEFTEQAPGIYEIELHEGGGVLTRVQAQ